MKIGMLRRTARQLSVKARRQYVLSIVLPDLEYCSVAFLTSASAQDRLRVHKLYNRAVRAASCATYQDDRTIPELLSKLRLPSLEYRFVSLFARFIFRNKIVHPLSSLSSLFPIPSTTRSTRGSSVNTYVMRPNSKDGVNSFSNRAALLFNAFPLSLRYTTSFSDFKQQFTKLLRDPQHLQRYYSLLFHPVTNA